MSFYSPYLGYRMCVSHFHVIMGGLIKEMRLNFFRSKGKLKLLYYKQLLDPNMASQKLIVNDGVGEFNPQVYES